MDVGSNIKSIIAACNGDQQAAIKMIARRFKCNQSTAFRAWRGEAKSLALIANPANHHYH